MAPGPEREDAGPLVSIITVCLDAERHIREALQSVLEQTYPHIEYLVIDGGSKDSTHEILREYEPLFAGRMRWRSEPDDGIYHAMNKGLDLVKGDLIGLLNADDFFMPDTIEAVVATSRAHPGAGIIYGGTCNVDEHGTVILDRPAPPEVTQEVMMAGMLFSHQSMFVSAETYRQCGTYDTRYEILADWEFVLRCIRAGVEFADAHTRLSAFRVGGVSGAGGLQFDRELTEIRVAYGASPIREWSRHYRIVALARAYAVLSRLPGFAPSYERYKARRRAR